jgi:hypothetical protein
MNISASSTNSVNSAIPDGPDLDPSFTALLAETATVISSPNFSKVVEAALDHISEELLLSGILANVFGRKQPDEEEASQETAEPRMRLAAMLPGLARWSRLALTGLPNELVNVGARVRSRIYFSVLICYHSAWANSEKSRLSPQSYLPRSRRNASSLAIYLVVEFCAYHIITSHI